MNMASLPKEDARAAVDAARDLARDNLSMFLFGSVAIGFGLSRFLKAARR
jgi:hypothetical protein